MRLARGAAIVLGTIPDVLRVRITAPERVRVQRVARDDPLLYDAVLNTETLTAEMAVHFLRGTLEKVTFNAAPHSR